MGKRKIFKNLRKEFSEFAFKEATLGAAVGIMLGGALKDVISSLVNDILTPPIAYVTSGIDFTKLYFTLDLMEYESIEAARSAGVAVVHYGNFINEFVSFLITAFFLFLIAYQGTKMINRLKKKDEAKKKKEERKCPYCTLVIDDKATRCPHCTSKL